MTEKEKELYVEKLASKGSVLGLQNMRNLMPYLGNPEKHCKVIQIAGTNGKGSILAMLSAVLCAAGYKVGTYSSPAVFEEREIIRKNGRNISERDYLYYFGKLKETTDAMEEEGLPCPTLFEVQTAMAYLYFAEKKTDIVLMEAGMGGREDATNICEENLAAVFATISLDHMQILGKTVEAIAAVKAGIMKKGCPVVIGNRQSTSVQTVLKKQAEALACRIYEPQEISQVKCLREKTEISYGDYKRLATPLLGRHQSENLAAVVDTVMALRGQGYCISDAALKDGLMKTIWPGRLERISSKPMILLDGAHNEGAAEVLREALLQYTKEKPLILILGMFRDKEYDKVIRLLAPLAAHVVTLTAPNPVRALPAHELAEEVRKVNPAVTETGSIEEAAEMAMLLSGGICPIVACGSLSYLGTIKRCFLGKTKTGK